MNSKKILTNLGLLGAGLSLFSCSSEIQPGNLYPNTQNLTKDQKIIQNTYQQIHNDIEDSTVCISNQRIPVQYALREYAQTPEGKQMLRDVGYIHLEAKGGFRAIRGMFVAGRNSIYLSARTTTTPSSYTGTNRDVDDFRCVNVLAHEFRHASQWKRDVCKVSSRASFEQNIMSSKLGEFENQSWDLVHETIEEIFGCFYCEDQQKINAFMARDLIAEGIKKARKEGYQFDEAQFCATDLPYRLQKHLKESNGSLELAQTKLAADVIVDFFDDKNVDKANNKTPWGKYYLYLNELRCMYDPKAISLAAAYSLSKTGDSPSWNKTKADFRLKYGLDIDKLGLGLSCVGRGMYLQYRPEYQSSYQAQGATVSGNQKQSVPVKQQSRSRE